jgi:hypothetical protein
MAPGSNVIKLFSFSLMRNPNKLEHLTLENPFKPSLIIGIKARAYPNVAPFRDYTLQ